MATIHEECVTVRFSILARNDEVVKKHFVSDEQIQLIDETLKEVDFTRAVFLDTETTGLAGGAGTVPFLVGLGSGAAEAQAGLLGELDRGQ